MFEKFINEIRDEYPTHAVVRHHGDMSTRWMAIQQLNKYSPCYDKVKSMKVNGIGTTKTMFEKDAANMYKDETSYI